MDTQVPARQVVGAGPGDWTRHPDLEAARAVADAVLYEGYLLYPYRQSSGKNAVRWQFGVLAPRAWLAAQGPVDETSLAGSAESWFAQTECLLAGAESGTEIDPEIEVCVRFLQMQERLVQARRPDGYADVPELTVDGRRLIPFTEAVPHELTFTLVPGARQQRLTVVPAGEETEAVGAGAGRIVRRREPVTLALEVSSEPVTATLTRLRLRLENTDAGPPPDLPRSAVLSRSLLAAHLLLVTGTGRFLSLADPPPDAADAARACRNIHTFPVITGRDDRIVLSSPIILYDHPQIAPESPGNLHDATEIDEILSLRTLTLSDAEKAEVRATDARAAEILDRVETMPPELFERLHGAARSLRTPPLARPAVPEPDGAPDQPMPAWWTEDAAAPDPETDSVVVAGTTIGRGALVRLRPHPGGDPHDMFVSGRTARVARVLRDHDDNRLVAVTLLDDPGADLDHWYGRHRHFSPDELEPVGDNEGGPP